MYYCNYIYIYIQLYLCNHYILYIYYSTLKKIGDTIIYENMDDLGGHYIMWHKLRTERQTPHDLISMWNLRKDEVIEADCRMMVTRGW
jgi:hypothetical protein